jgi:cytochrome c oxidase cbb3-type subunit 3
LIGDAKAGESYFNNDGKCTSCHSASGDLAHIASKYKPFDLQTRIAFPSGAKPRVTVIEKTGNAVSGEQVYADEFLISLRTSDGRIRTWKRNLVKMEIRDPLAAHEELLKRYTDKNIHDLFAYLVTLK